MKPPATSSSSRRTVRRQPSPAQSTTSLSDENDDDDLNKSTFFGSSDPVATSPAQWSRIQSLSAGTIVPARKPRSQTSYASRLPPELLIHVLKHLHSTRDLYHSMLVSRGWCECSVELLWHRPNFTKLSTLVKMMRILSRNDQTFLYARFIRRLNFSLLGEEINDFLFTRIAQCVRLERLTLLNCSAITDAALTRVLPCCPNLVALDLTGVNDTTEKAIVALASSTKRLQGINLGGCKKLTDRGILALAANCPLLRRVKLCGLDQITDQAVSALAKSCPLLLEVDLTHCKLVTDESIRDIWTFSGNMREMRLSHCSELTDAAFPISPKNDILNAGPNPFPSSAPYAADRPSPLRLSKRFDHLRLLDLTACAAITDEAVEGIISVAPKIRNLVLAKCSLITDRAVESICALGKHLHYLHLGHANNITDRSIRSLARSCTRLRYIDLANCSELTDMSVFELAALPKLRRIGLVRVGNLTDHAIYALGDRYPILERIHLSYCDQITVLAIHFLLQKLPKLTHLSLTGIPAFRRSELQQFCRDPPPEFNSAQRSTFCVYSGDGVKALRSYLSELYNSITDDSSQQSGTEYEYDPEETYQTEGGEDDYDEQVDEEDAVFPELVPHAVPNGNFTIIRPGLQQHVPIDVDQTPQQINRELLMTRERGNRPVSRGSGAQTPPLTPTSHPAAIGRRVRGFPIIEASTSPTPSDTTSNRSGGTAHSTGTAFFRNCVDAATQSRAGVITPDLVFAEIGHGRGAGPAASGQFSSRRIVEQSMVVPTSYSTTFVGTSPHPSLNGNLIVEDENHQMNGHTVLADSSNSYQHAPSRTDSTSSWTQVNHEDTRHSLSGSPTTRELQESLQSAFAQQQQLGDVDQRGRSVKRSLRNTFTAAEHIASSFLFGRGANGTVNEGPSSSTRREGEHPGQ